jgi:hypothetical protein
MAVLGEDGRANQNFLLGVDFGEGSTIESDVTLLNYSYTGIEIVDFRRVNAARQGMAGWQRRAESRERNKVHHTRTVGHRLN